MHISRTMQGGGTSGSNRKSASSANQDASSNSNIKSKHDVPPLKRITIIQQTQGFGCGIKIQPNSLFIQSTS